MPGDGGYIVDDGDPDFQAPRVLERSNAAGYGGDYRYVNRARWSFYGIPAGEYELLATWQTASRNASDVAYRISDIEADENSHSVFVDQREGPADFAEHGVRWQNLGRVQIQDGGEVRVHVKDSAWFFLTPSVADAVWLRPILPAECGNGKTEQGEQCDDGNQNNADSCTNECVIAQCGDRICQVNEQRIVCPSDGHGFGSDSHGDMAGCHTTCPGDCEVVCGNGVIDPGEACDDYNALPGDGCSGACQVEETVECGNGLVENGEECDDGAANGLISSACTSECRIRHCEYDVQCPSDTRCIDSQCLLPIASCILNADLNSDGTVDERDLSEMLVHINQPGVRATGDVTGDGLVNIADVLQLITDFGRVCLSPAA